MTKISFINETPELKEFLRDRGLDEDTIDQFNEFDGMPTETDFLDEVNRILASDTIKAVNYNIPCIIWTFEVKNKVTGWLEDGSPKLDALLDQYNINQDDFYDCLNEPDTPEKYLKEMNEFLAETKLKAVDIKEDEDDFFWKFEIKGRE